MMYYTTFASPIGPLLLSGDERQLRGVSIQGGKHPTVPAADWVCSDAPFAAVRDHLTAYFEGEAVDYERPLEFGGSPFQRDVWSALRTIPYGTTMSYGKLAVQVGQPGGARAVGLANGRNPFAVIVPCHRVVGADGSLTGYGGGLARKQFLLDLESGRRPLPLV